MAKFYLTRNLQQVRGAAVTSTVAQRGAAIILVISVLLALGLLVLSLAGYQVIAHSQQISLDERRLKRQLATEQLFEDVASSLLVNSRPAQEQGRGYVAHLFAEGGAGQRVLYSEAVLAICPHEFPTLSLCWRIKVSQSGSGFVRERLLIMPKQSCAPPYWYPPEGRVVEGPRLPPANELPNYEPLPQPLTAAG